METSKSENHLDNVNSSDEGCSGLRLFVRVCWKMHQSMKKEQQCLQRSTSSRASLIHPQRIISYFDKNSVLYSFDTLGEWWKYLQAGNKNMQDQLVEDISKVNPNEFQCQCSRAKSEQKKESALMSCSKKYINEVFNYICEPSIDLKIKKLVERGESLDNKLDDSAYNIKKRQEARMLLATENFSNLYNHFVTTTSGNSVNMKIPRYCVEPAIFEWDTGLKKFPIDGSISNRIFPLEYVDYGSLFYRSCFYKKEHYNYYGEFPQYGPIVISVMKVRPKFQLPKSFLEITFENENENFDSYLIILRSVMPSPLRIQVPDIFNTSFSDKLSIHHKVKDMIEFIYPFLETSLLFPEANHDQFEENLLELDETELLKNVKIGVVYVKAEQNKESEIYENDDVMPEFYEFMDFLATRVKLRGYSGYAGGMDITTDDDGLETYATHFQNREIIFHVAPMVLRRAQAMFNLRKRLVGNDSVNIIFCEPDSKDINPNIFTTFYTQAFIVVKLQKNSKHASTYSVSVSRLRFLPHVGPKITQESFKLNEEFRHWVLTKALNLDTLVKRSTIYETKAVIMREAQLKEFSYLASDSASVETIVKNKMGIFKKSQMKLKTKDLQLMESFSTYGISLPCNVTFDQNFEEIACFLVTSYHSISFLHPPTKATLMQFPTYCLEGWHEDPTCLKLFYKNLSIIVRFEEESKDDIKFLINRLNIIATGSKALIITLKESCNVTSYKFNRCGDVLQMVSKSPLHRAGILPGCKIFEINGKPFYHLTSRDIQDMLKEGDSKTICYKEPSQEETKIQASTPAKTKSSGSTRNRSMSGYPSDEFCNLSSSFCIDKNTMTSSKTTETCGIPSLSNSTCNSVGTGSESITSIRSTSKLATRGLNPSSKGPQRDSQNQESKPDSSTVRPQSNKSTPVSQKVQNIAPRPSSTQTESKNLSNSKCLGSTEKTQVTASILADLCSDDQIPARSSSLQK